MDINKEYSGQDLDLNKLLFRYLSFWPYILISTFILFISAFLYLKYANYTYTSHSVIEVIDKAQDNEMALPTSMTIFNRSMINLENEFGRLSSYNLNAKVVSELNSNVKYYTEGDIKISQNHISDFFPSFNLDFLIDTDTIKSKIKFEISVYNNKMNISKYDNKDDLVYNKEFKQLSTRETKHELPFELNINSLGKNSKDKVFEKILVINPFNSTVLNSINSLSFSQYISERKSSNTVTKGSDQIKISILSTNTKIAEDYLRTLIKFFDYDGITERQLEYKRTIDFAEERAKFLEKEVQLIEKRKQDFKKLNKLTNLEADANMTISMQYDYDSELFKIESQKELVNLLKNELSEDSYNLLPSNFGLENTILNESINQYNDMLKERIGLISYGAGSNSYSVRNIESQINDLYKNIINSIDNYVNSLETRINNIKSKEKEFENFYSSIPEKERFLMEIERELSVKVALYSLLLQKKEEAAINNAVVKPTIKIIDSPLSAITPTSPNRQTIYLVSIFAGFFIPIFLLTIWFVLDTKIHTKDDLNNLDIPILVEVPHLKNTNNINIDDISSSSRSPLLESIRMLIANLKYSASLIGQKEKKSIVLLISSSIKGEGKTLISTFVSKVLSFNKKVLLIGADLRNPQIHKLTNFEKDEKGVSDFLYSESLDYKNLIKKSGNLDILFSGTIPPNPTELLSTEKFKTLVSNLKSSYDYIVIDSAPCLLVADTLQFSKIADISMMICRANHTKKDVLDFIYQLNKSGKFNKMGIVLNSVGNSAAYGYKYGYQYGYKYGYNYGYGYGYGNNEN